MWIFAKSDFGIMVQGVHGEAMFRGTSPPRTTFRFYLNPVCLLAAHLLAARATLPSIADNAGSIWRRPGALPQRILGELGWNGMLAECREGKRGSLIGSIRLRGGSGHTGKESWKGNGDDEMAELRSADDVFQRPMNTGMATTPSPCSESLPAALRLQIASKVPGAF